MKSVLFAVIMMAINAQAAYILKPQSGDKYKCFDDVSYYTYELEIVDIGDEEAEIKVFDLRGRKIEHYKPTRSRNIGLVNLSRGGMDFKMIQDGKVVRGVFFEVYDLDSAYSYNPGDSSALDCEILK